MTTHTDELTPAALDTLRAQLEADLPYLKRWLPHDNTLYTLALLVLDTEGRLRALEAARRDEEGGK